MYLTKRHQLFELGSDNFLLCNGMTGDVLVVNQTIAALLGALREGRLSQYDNEAVSALKERGFLFDSEADEERRFEEVCQIGWEQFRDRAPRVYTFVVNSHCNFNCPYCFESEDLRARSSSITVEQVNAAFQVIDEYENEQLAVPSFNLFGGEPLLPPSKQILSHVLYQLGERKYTTDIQSNGYHLLNFISFIGEHQRAIKSVQVTIDGPETLHNKTRVLKSGGETFGRIISGIDAFHASDIKIDLYIRTNVDRNNVNSLSQIADLYRKKGWASDKRFHFTVSAVHNRNPCGSITKDRLLGQHDLLRELFPLSVDTGNGPFSLENFKVISHLRSRFRNESIGGEEAEGFVPRVVHCAAAGLKYFVFHPDGKLYPCPEVLGMPNFSIGTYYPSLILDPSRTALWSEQTILKRKDCKSCTVSTYCGGGCLLGALQHQGSSDGSHCEEAPKVFYVYLDEIRKNYQASSGK